MRLALAAALIVALRLATDAQAVHLDDFENLSGWSISASSGTQVWIVPDAGHTGKGMRIDFEFAGGGYLIVHKAFALALPDNYAFTFYLRGEAPENNFEFKLLDPSGKNVWWRRQRDFSFPTQWQQITIRKSRLEFAWGPAGGAELKRVGAIEFAISAGRGGKGSVWIDDLQFERREPSSPVGVTPVVSTSSALPGQPPTAMVDQDPRTLWRSAPDPAAQWVLIDMLKNCEYGGLVIDWDAEDFATTYRVEVSTDAEHWTTAQETTDAGGGREYVYMPDAESRYIRLDLEHSSRGRGYAIAAITVEPYAFSASPNQFFSAIARDSPTGIFPKYFLGKQTYWTLVGVGGDGKVGLLNEEGMLEVDKGAFSIEPFLYADGDLITWNTAQITQTLDAGDLPIPSVRWQHGSLSLTTTAFASGDPGASILYARYRIENHGNATARADLFLTLRPFQVNPPWQSLNMVGGVAPIHEMQFDGHAVWVDRNRAVIVLPSPDRFGAAPFAQGMATRFVREDRVPSSTQVNDPSGFASGALEYHFTLDAGTHQDVYLAVPFHDPYVAAALGLGTDEGPAFIAGQLEQTRRHWQTILGRTEIDVPPDAAAIAQSVKTNVAYMLINRNGPAIEPGARNYARSWIRDGALISSALLEMDSPRPASDFLRWFVRYQGADGRIPCCVDQRGADSAREYDADGEFIYGVMQYYRYTRDVGFLSDLWPHVLGAVGHLEALRSQRLTAEYRRPDKSMFYGLLPESISHEGYAPYPVHSYWDDFFALRGFKDAARMAVILGDDEHAGKFAALRDAFRQDLYASIAKTMAQHQIDYIPGSVELGDFDPTSLAIALTVGGERQDLPEPALTRSFDRYYADFEHRRAAQGSDEAYTPYELRNVGALIRLGERERAWEVLNYVMGGQRPPAWHGWAEVVWRNPDEPRFIGDMPHTWVGCNFVRAVRGMFAYERESDQALVLAAGLPPHWILDGPGVAVKRLATYYGPLNYSLRRDGPQKLRLRISGDLTVPPGKIVLDPPLPGPLALVTVNGRPVQSFSASSATIDEVPADVVLEYTPSTATPSPSATPTAAAPPTAAPTTTAMPEPTPPPAPPVATPLPASPVSTAPATASPSGR